MPRTATAKYTNNSILSDQQVSQVSQRVLPALLDDPQTAKALGLKPYEVQSLQAHSLVTPRTVVRTGRRGRPAHVLALTPKARKRAKRLAVPNSVTQ